MSLDTTCLNLSIINAILIYHLFQANQGIAIRIMTLQAIKYRQKFDILQSAQIEDGQMERAEAGTKQAD
jgi:hypothetical protein